MSAAPTPEVVCGLPYCQHAEAKQTTPSIIIRITVFILGLLAVLAAILMFCKVPILCACGPTAAYVAFPLGIVAIILAAFIKQIEKPDAPSSISISEPRAITQLVQVAKDSKPNTSSTFGINFQIYATHMCASKGDAHFIIMMKESDHLKNIADFIQSHQTQLNDLMTLDPKVDQMELQVEATSFAQVIKPQWPKEAMGAWCFVRNKTVCTEVFGSQAALLVLENKYHTKYGGTVISLKLRSWDKDSRLLDQQQNKRRDPGTVDTLTLSDAVRLEFYNFHDRGFQESYVLSFSK